MYSKFRESARLCMSTPSDYRQILLLYKPPVNHSICSSIHRQHRSYITYGLLMIHTGDTFIAFGIYCERTLALSHIQPKRHTQNGKHRSVCCLTARAAMLACSGASIRPQAAWLAVAWWTHGCGGSLSSSLHGSNGRLNWLIFHVRAQYTDHCFVWAADMIRIVLPLRACEIDLFLL